MKSTGEKFTYLHDQIVQILEKHCITTAPPDDMSLIEIADDIEALVHSLSIGR